MKDGDYVRKILTTSTHDRILFFTNKGKVYMKTAYDIPESSRTARGSAMINFITSLGADEHVTELLDLDISEEGTKYLLMVTKYGYIKKTALEEYKNINKNGLIAMRLKEDDRLVAVLPVKGDEEIIMGTRKGMAIRFSIDDDNVRPLSRSASGVHGMRLKEGDDVVGVVVAAEKDILPFPLTETRREMLLPPTVCKAGTDRGRSTSRKAMKWWRLSLLTTGMNW